MWKVVLGDLPWFTCPPQSSPRPRPALCCLCQWWSALCLQVLQGAQLIAVASSDPAAAGVDGSPLQGSDIQVQYVQLAPVTDHTTAAQVGPLSGNGRPVCGQVLRLLQV